MTPLRFFAIGGVVLIISGLLQIFVLPRKPNENRWINGATVRALFFVVVGVAAVLVGTGTLPLEGLGIPMSR